MLTIISKVCEQYLCALITMIGVHFFGKIILEEKTKVSKKRLFLLLQLICIIYVLDCILLDETFKALIMFVVDVLYFIIVFKTNKLKSILSIFIYATILIAAELLSLFSMTIILGINKSFLYKNIAGSIAGNIIICLVSILLIYILKKQLKEIVNNQISNNKKIVILSISTLIGLLLFFYNIIREFKFNNNIATYLVTIAIMTITLFSLIKQTIKNNRIMREYDNLLEFMTTYETEIEKQRILRHEIKNEFRTIRAKLCDKEKSKEIIEYIDEIVKDKYKIDKEKYAKFGSLPPNGIKGLCYFKVQSAEKMGINVDIAISKRIEKSIIYKLSIKEQRDFGRILGVYLDNAIEASKESKKKQMGIEAYTNSKDEFQMIITNTYDNKKLDKTKIGIESFSTKGKNRGHGLLLVKQLVNKNKIFETATDIEENLYIQKIKINNISNNNR